MSGLVIASLMAKVGADTSGAEIGLGRLKGLLQNTGDSFGGLGKMAGLGLLGAGAAVAGFGVAAGKMATDFDAGMREVNTMTGLGEAGFQDFSASVLKMSQDIGVDAVGSTKALYQAISAGVPKGNAVEFLATAAKAAIGGVTDTETAVNGLTNYINAWGLSSKDASTVADSMFATVKGGKTTFAELSDSIFNVAPVAASMGVSFTDVNAALEAMTKQAVPTSVATTQLRQVMVELSKPGKELADVLESVGIADGKAALESEGLQGVLGKLADYGKKTGMTMNQMFGSVEAASAANLLAGKNANFFTDALRNQAGAAGASAGAFAEMERSTTRQWTRLTNAFSTMMIGAGSRILPAITPIIATIADKLPAAFDAVGRAVDASGVVPFFQSIGAMVGPLVENIKSLFSGDIAGGLTSLFDTVIGMRAGLVEALGGWAAVFQKWIGPMIPPFLVELGKIGAAVFDWAEAQIPVLAEQFAGWVSSVISWATAAIPPLLSSLGTMAASLLDWINAEAPTLAERLLGEWVPAAILWVAETAIRVIPELAKMLWAIGTWIVGTGAPKLGEIAINLGSAIVVGVVKGLSTLAEAASRSIYNAMRNVNVPLPTFDLTFGGAPYFLPSLNIGVGWHSLAEWLPELAKGGDILKEGMALVGERGPEVVNLPSGAQVRPLSAGATGSYGGGGIDYQRLGNAVADALGRAGLRVDMDGAQVARLLYPHTQQLVRL